MSTKPVKFTPEWHAAKAQARKDLDYRLSVGARHGDKHIVAPASPEPEQPLGPIGFNKPKAPRKPKEPKAPRKPKEPKAPRKPKEPKAPQE
jgi:hypothetical protein